MHTHGMGEQSHAHKTACKGSPVSSYALMLMLMLMACMTLTHTGLRP